MLPFKTATSSVFQYFLALHLTLWGAFKTGLRGCYLLLRKASRVYSPAKSFLIKMETTVNRLRTDSAAPPELKLQKLLQEVWGPSTTLESLVSSALRLLCHVHSCLGLSFGTQISCCSARCRARSRWLSRSCWLCWVSQVCLRDLLLALPEPLNHADDVFRNCRFCAARVLLGDDTVRHLCYAVPARGAVLRCR